MDAVDYIVFAATLGAMASALLICWLTTRNLKDPTEGGAE